MERHIFQDDECRCLCLPESPDSILEQTDYYAFFTYSMLDGNFRA